MPSKRNNCINPEGGGRKLTFEYIEDDGMATRQVLALQKKAQKKCEEMKNEKNDKGLRREIKIRRFLRLNNPYKAPFQIKIK